ncbi:MAG: hypothetical protein HDT30_00515 [Clostridiales bacterium]|nr:hypothetical protein [Clostridiales bacterium]
MPKVQKVQKNKLYYGVWTENIKEIYDLQPGNYCMVKTFFFETYNCSPVQLALPFEV